MPIDQRVRPAGIAVNTHHSLIPGVDHYIDPIGEYRAIQYSIYYDVGGVPTAGPMFNVDPTGNITTPDTGAISGTNIVRLRNAANDDYAYLRLKGVIIDGENTVIIHEEMQVADNIIILNSNITGSPTEDAGIEIERGSETNASLFWNETDHYWQVSRINELSSVIDNSEIVRYEELGWSGRAATPNFESFMGSEKVGDKNWDTDNDYPYLYDNGHLSGKPETVRGTLLAIDAALADITSGGVTHNKMTIRQVEASTPPTYGASHLLTLGTDSNDQRIDFTPSTTPNLFLATRASGAGSHVPYFRTITVDDLPAEALVPTGTMLHIAIFDEDGNLNDIYTNSLGSYTAVVKYNIAPSANRVYTIDTGISSSNFVMTAGNQTIAGIKTFSSQVVITPATNQLKLYNTTINATSGSARTYVIPQVNTNANFIMSEGDQIINGVKSFRATQVEIGESGNTTVKKLRMFSHTSGYVDLEAPGSASGDNRIILPIVPTVSVSTPYYVRATITSGKVATLSLVPENEISFPGVSDIKVAGQAITKGDVLRIASTGKVFKAQANSVNTSTVYGIAMADASIDAEVEIMINGILNFDSDIVVGADIGDSLYLSSTVAGGLSDSIPSAAESTITKVGVKSASNQIKIMLYEPIILS